MLCWSVAPTDGVRMGSTVIFKDEGAFDDASR